MRGRAVFLGLITFLASTAASLLALELVLTLLPVSEGTINRPVSRDEPVLTFVPDDEAVYSRDWNFSYVNRFRVNAQGFVNKYDYDAVPGTPVLAVIGDSYVEATMVPYEETLQGRLEDDARSRYGGRFRVYSFGASGAPLSQYLAYARYAQARYDVESMIFVIIANDFDESMPKYAAHGAFHVFAPDGAGGYRLEPPGDYEPVQGLLRQSALIRYLHFHLRISRTIARLRALAAGRSEQGQYADNTAADASERRLSDARAAVDAFLALLPSYTELPNGRIALVVDAQRSDLYDVASLEELPDSYFARTRRYLLERAAAQGYHVVDMAPRFFRAHNETGVYFEWPTDGHWNGAGHGEAYEAVRDSGFYRQFIDVAMGAPEGPPVSALN